MGKTENHEKEIYYEAAGIKDPQRRTDYLNLACGADNDLRNRVQALLDANIAAGAFLDSPPVESVIQTNDRDGLNSATTNRHVGPYKLLEKIGEGGFGEVYMAEQSQPIQRRVALKIIKPGMDSKQVIARFEAERQALALMDHPNIARIFDAGETENGRPYFAMELVRGVAITEYCDDRSLSTDDRLQLFVEICSAVQHAHQKGIIHRDIKPTNILVYNSGNRAVPKIIDFGIAKATQGRLTNKTLFTQFRQFIGTPTYMSPEQAQMSGIDIDTRSDIYSLGVLLYELLTGSTPLDLSELESDSFDRICQRIREEEPARPSARVSTMTKKQRTSVAQVRSAEPESLGRLMRGELDWIVMKAVEKDRSRRYDTASAFALDVRRYLTNEPVEAGPPSLRYRARKFASRNRVAVTTTALIALALIAGAVASGIGLIQARRAQGRLEVTQAELEVQLSVTDIARQQAEANLYAAEMNRAATAYQQGSVELALSLLERHQETRGDRFEWRLIHRMCQRDDSVHTFRGHTDEVRTVAVSSRGMIASGSADRTFRIYDLDHRREIAAKIVPNEVNDIEFSPDGTVLAVCERSGVVTIWDVDSLKELNRLPPALTNGVNITFFPDGETLVVVDDFLNGKTRLWNWQTPTATPVELEAFGHHVSVSPDGNVMCFAVVGNIDVWRKREGEGFAKSAFISLAHDWTINDIVFARPSGEHFATTDGSETLIWKTSGVEDAELSETPTTPRMTINARAQSLAYSPDDRHLAAASGLGKIEIWQAQPEYEFPLWNLQGRTGLIGSMAYSQDGKWIVTGSEDHTVKLWPASPPKQDYDETTEDDWVFAIRFSGDDQWIAAGKFDGRVVVFDTQTMEKQFDEKRHDQQVFGVAFSPNGEWLASCSGQWRYDDTGGHEDSLGRVSLVNLADRTKDHYVDGVTAEFRGLDFSSQGELLAFGDSNGTLQIWDAIQQKVVVQIETSKRIRNVRFSPDGKLLAIANGDKRCLDLRDAKSLELLSSFGTHYSRGIAFSPDGKTIAYVMHDKIQLLETDGLKPVKILEGGPGRFWNVAFLPDGKTVAACGSHGNVILWDIETGRDVVSLPPHIGYATGLAVSHNGNMLASSGADKTIRIWRADDVSESVKVTRPNQ